MKIAVTGGNGRIGQAVVQLAQAEGHELVVLDRVTGKTAVSSPKTTFIQADITDYDALETALRGCDALIHLAAIPAPGRHPDHLVHNNNVVGSYNALRAAAACGIWRVCQASSINAIGGAYSRWPRYDYFPIDEQHPTYAEDPYSLSKWLCELQADAMVRRYEQMAIASLRLHGVVDNVASTARWADHPHNIIAKHLWGYTSSAATARACLLAITAVFSGHHPLYIVAPQTMMATPSRDLAAQFYPNVPIRGAFAGNQGFFNCQKAEQLLGWRHDSEKL